MLVFDFAPTNANIVPGTGKHADVIPQILPVVHRIRDVAIGEAIIFLGPGVIRAPDGEIDGFAVPVLALFVDLTMVDHVILVGWWRQEKHEQIMALLG